MTLTYGSLCTGYDGIGLGLALAGLEVEPLWMAEVEPSMSRVLKREHETVPNVGDIKAAPWRLAPHVSIMSSGDPCQAISIAGRQQGREDDRFLWPWVRQAYRAVRPDVLFFENVANMVSHDGGRTMAERFVHLREDGYEVRWTVLGACAVGAPHHRHRWYAVAVRWAGRGPVPEARRVGGKAAICGAPRSGGRALLPSPMARDADGRGEGDEAYWRKRVVEQGRSNGMPLGAAVALLPSPRAADAGRFGSEDRSLRVKTGGTLQDAVCMLPTPTTSNAHGNDVNSRGELLLPGIAARPEIWGKYAAAVALWEQVTGVPAPEPTEPATKGGRRLSAALPEWMMGLRPGLLTDELTRPEALKGAGNGVVPLAAAAAWRLLTES